MLFGVCSLHAQRLIPCLLLRAVAGGEGGSVGQRFLGETEASVGWRQHQE